MSWLYSIFLAGLALSNTSQPVKLPATQNASTAVYNRLDETERFDQTYPLTANGRVSVSNVNGGITVEAWDRNEVRVEYTKTADSKERLADVEVRIETRPDAINIETDYDNWKKDKDRGWKFSGKLEVEFHLMVPRGAMLNEIETVNGSVTVSNFTNFTKISAVNGTVRASNIRGTAKLSTVNGEVQADFDRLENGSRISLDTVNGRVNLVIPSDSSATVKADSLNGSITNDFGLRVRKGKYVGRDLYGRLGSGDVQIKLSSVNGGLAINRKNDGRSLSPATDLLTDKGKDDDWDGDVDVDVDAEPKVKIDQAKLNRDIQKSVKESQKAAAKAVADANVEIARIGPEIARAVSDAAATAASLDTPEMRDKIREAVREQARLERAVNAVFLPGVPRVDTKSETFQVKGTPTVTVAGSDCSVRISGWDRSEVQYRVVRFAPPRANSTLGITALHSDTTVDLKVEEAPGSRMPNRESTRIEIMVPKRSNLKVRVDGEVRLEGVTGQLDIDGPESAVNVRDAAGRLHVASNDARVRVIGFRGDIDVTSGDGPISVEGDFDSLKATAGDGPINIVVPASFSADLESNCPSITADGVALTRVSSQDDRSLYRLGSGGGRRLMVETEGKIIIRSAATITQSN